LSSLTLTILSLIDCEVLEATEEIEDDEEVVLAEDDTDDVEESEGRRKSRKCNSGGWH